MKKPGTDGLRTAIEQKNRKKENQTAETMILSKDIGNPEES